MIEITMQDARVGVHDAGEEKVLILQDPQSGITVRVGFQPDGAAKIAAALGPSGIEIASQIPAAMRSWFEPLSAPVSPAAGALSGPASSPRISPGEAARY